MTERTETPRPPEPLEITVFTMDLGDGKGDTIAAAYPCARTGEPACEDVSHDFICSRVDGHDGPHVAYGGADFFCAAWPLSPLPAQAAKDGE